jgi:hypothetical protein
VVLARCYTPRSAACPHLPCTCSRPTRLHHTALQEPNNAGGSELCGVANASETFDVPFAWGWADADCRLTLPFMCKAQPAGSSFVYISPRSKVTFVLETSPRAFVEAQYSCNQHGGHLAHYDSLAEQVRGGCRGRLQGDGAPHTSLHLISATCASATC